MATNLYVPVSNSSFKKKVPKDCFDLLALCLSSCLCARKDSNLHSVNYQILSLARLPIPPRAHKCECKDTKNNRNGEIVVEKRSRNADPAPSHNGEQSAKVGYRSCHFTSRRGSVMIFNRRNQMREEPSTWRVVWLPMM